MIRPPSQRQTGARRAAPLRPIAEPPCCRGAARTCRHRGLARLLLMAALAAAGGPAPAQPVGNESSPQLSWDPYREIGNANQGFRVPPELARHARERATRFFDAVKSAPAYSQPQLGRASFLTALPSMSARTVMSLDMRLYWSQPRDVHRQADGALFPVLGGAHLLLKFSTNAPRNPSHLGESRFVRQADAGPGAALAPIYLGAPTEHGQLAGGTIYDHTIVFTRDGRSALAPAPLGALLAIEIAWLEKVVADSDRHAAQALRELDASMTPEAVAARRAKREQAWARQTRDPEAMARRLDAAHRSDESYEQRRRQELQPTATKDPQSRTWGPRLALDAIRAQWAALDEAGRAGAACALPETQFRSGRDARFWPLASAPAGCHPMVQARPELIDPGRPATEVQLLEVSFGDSPCGRALGLAASGGPPAAGLCIHAVPLLREMDWPAVRRAIGW